MAEQFMMSFSGEKVNIYEYEKSPRAEYTGNVTGQALQVPTSPYAVVDFDIYTEDMKLALKEKILQYCTE